MLDAGSLAWVYFSYLDKGFGSLEEVLASTGFRSLLIPVNDGLVRDAVFIIQDLGKKKSIQGEEGVGEESLL